MRVEVERLEEVGRFAAAERRRQSVRRELDEILPDGSRAGHHIVDAVIRAAFDAPPAPAPASA